MSLIIAAAQSASVAGDVAGNVERHLRFARIAAENGAQLLVFPELSLTGYELSLARSHPVTSDSPELQPLRALAARAAMTIVAGAPLPGEVDLLHIGAHAMRADGSITTYTKVHVHQSEQPVFTVGSGGSTLLLGNATVALAICADAKHPQHAAGAAARGANVYAVGAMVTGDAYEGKAALLERYAREHAMAVLLANYSGSTGGDLSAGRSAIWSEGGQLVTASAGTEEALVIAVKENGRWKGRVVPVSAGAATRQVGS